MGFGTIAQLLGQDGYTERDKLQPTLDWEAGREVFWMHVAESIHGRTRVQSQIPVHLSNQGETLRYEIYFKDKK